MCLDTEFIFNKFIPNQTWQHLIFKALKYKAMLMDYTVASHYGQIIAKFCYLQIDCEFWSIIQPI